MYNASYWEKSTWLNNIDFVIVGAGIVGINCAINLKARYPKARVVVLERGVLPSGASTKNAGFACFGSLSEIIDDLKTHTEEEVLALVQKRVNGLVLLRKTLSDKTIEYRETGGYEIFLKENKAHFEHCLSRKEEVNRLLNPIFNKEVFQTTSNPHGFKGIVEHGFFNPMEGMINTGKMMQALYKLAVSKDILFFHQEQVLHYEEESNAVTITTTNFSLKATKLFVATNGFASQLLQEEVKPARAQVLITKPIKNLKIKGTFHLDKGYYYFRNVDNRILLGGGRNLDFKAEETTYFGITPIVQYKLENLLQDVILPGQKVEIDYRWSGIMGVGSQKKAIVKQVSNHVYCGVRLGGMGIAIGTLIGKELADLLD
ncbi:MAG TPA: FAD-dependent oxidoreductase [Flavobacteriaceae bacterium]|nr:FAD-dependent oxidoreductase [Flavobacteriaceae bacterium]